MKRSFFLALGLYMALFGALVYLYQAPQLPAKSKRISLSSITIKKRLKCTCNPCRCSNCAAHPKLKQKIAHEENPVQKEPIQKRAIKKAQPKKEPHKKSKPKKIHKKVRKKPKKIRKRIKKPKKVNLKRSKKAPKKVLAKAVPAKKVAHTEPISKASTNAKVSKPAPPPAPISPQPPSTAKPYQEVYVDMFADKIRWALQKNLFYPRIARKTRKQGVVEVGFTLHPDKRLENLRIIKSSGHSILDRSAIKTVKRASRDFPAPQKSVDLRVPIEYRLR